MRKALVAVLLAFVAGFVGSAVLTRGNGLMSLLAVEPEGLDIVLAVAGAFAAPAVAVAMGAAVLRLVRLLTRRDAAMLSQRVPG
ncbi:MAG: hypothetical protein KDJ41_13250 [Hyphomicrobiaceae bacterium]|nr:hypothetical protein [Hyphomicrobiaceae bacterium]